MYALVIESNVDHTVDALPQSWGTVTGLPDLPPAAQRALGWYVVEDVPYDDVENEPTGAYTYEILVDKVKRTFVTAPRNLTKEKNKRKLVMFSAMVAESKLGHTVGAIGKVDATKYAIDDWHKTAMWMNATSATDIDVRDFDNAPLHLTLAQAQTVAYALIGWRIQQNQKLWQKHADIDACVTVTAVRAISW